MRFKLNIDCDNDAFGESSADREMEVARILRALATRLEAAGFGDHAYLVRDVNGNTVGAARFLRDGEK